MHVKTAEASYEKWIRKSIMAFLEGQKDLKGITGTIGGYVFQARAVLIGLKGYGYPERHKALLN